MEYDYGRSEYDKRGMGIDPNIRFTFTSAKDFFYLHKFKESDIWKSIASSGITEKEKRTLENTAYNIGLDMHNLERFELAVARFFAKKFTEEQLECIIQAIKDHAEYFTSVPETRKKIYEFIRNEGRFAYKLGDIKDFKSKLSRINAVDLMLFNSLAVRLWSDHGLSNSVMVRYFQALIYCKTSF